MIRPKFFRLDFFGPPGAIIVHCCPGTYGREEIYLYGIIVKTSYQHAFPIHTVQVKAAGKREDEIWLDLTYPQYVTAHSGSEFLECTGFIECTGNTDAPPKVKEIALHHRTDLTEYRISKVNAELEKFNRRARIKEHKALKQGYLDEYELSDPGKELYEQSLHS
jgi:hypothetical protein